MDIFFQGEVCVCVSHCQVDSQMATPSADPCLALADAQLASAAEQAGPCRPSGTSQEKRFVDKVITLLLLPLCHTHLPLLHLLLYSVAHFKCVLGLIS